MGLSEIVWACRRHWRVIVVATARGRVGWLTTPSRSSVVSQQRNDVSYRATATLVSDGTTTDSLDRLVLFATAGDVPASVRKLLGDKPVPIADSFVNPSTGAWSRRHRQDERHGHAREIGRRDPDHGERQNRQARRQRRKPARGQTRGRRANSGEQRVRRRVRRARLATQEPAHAGADPQPTAARRASHELAEDRRRSTPSTKRCCD